MLLTCLSIGLLFLGYTRGHQSGHRGQHKRPDVSGDYDRGHVLDDVRETYGVDIDEKDVSDQDMDTYYFDTHDFDKNDKLDGLELLYALNHMQGYPGIDEELTTDLPGQENGDQTETLRRNNRRKWSERFDLDSEFIDMNLAKYDHDMDGFISYPEFRKYRIERSAEPMGA